MAFKCNACEFRLSAGGGQCSRLSHGPDREYQHSVEVVVAVYIAERLALGRHSNRPGHGPEEEERQVEGVHRRGVEARGGQDGHRDHAGGTQDHLVGRVGGLDVDLHRARATPP